MALGEWGSLGTWGSEAPVITGVTSDLGADTVEALGVFTISTTDSIGTISVTVGGIACTDVAALPNGLDIVATAPKAFGDNYGTVRDVVVNNGADSAGYAVTVGVNQAQNETVFTLPLSTDSPFYNDPAYATLASGYSCVYNQVTTPGDQSVHTITMSVDGVFTINPPNVYVDQSFSFYIFDDSDKTAGSDGVITINANTQANLSITATLPDVNSTVTLNSVGGMSINSTLDDVSSGFTLSAEASASINSVLDDVGSSVALAAQPSLSITATCENVSSTFTLINGSGVSISSTLDNVSSIFNATAIAKASINYTTDEVTSTFNLVGVASSNLSIAKTLDDVSSTFILDAIAELSFSAALDDVSGTFVLSEFLYTVPRSLTVVCNQPILTVQ